MPRPNISLYQSVGKTLGNIGTALSFNTYANRAKAAIAAKKRVEDYNTQQLFSLAKDITAVTSYALEGAKKNKELEMSLKSLNELEEGAQVTAKTDYGFLNWKKYFATPDIELDVKYTDKAGVPIEGTIGLTKDEVTVLDLLLQKRKLGKALNFLDNPLFENLLMGE